MPDSPRDDDPDLLDLAYPYALDAVSEADRAEIADRLAAATPQTADRFARIVADTQQTMALLAAADARTPPPGLRARILRAVHADPAAGTVTELAGRPAPRQRFRRALLAAAAAVLVGVGATVAIGQLHRQAAMPTIGQVLASPDTHTVTAEVAGGTITLRSSARVNAVVVEMVDVPAPPADHVYQMWFVPASGAPRSAGTMSADTMPPPGGTVIPVLDSAVSVTVTVEPGAGSAQPTGAPVVTLPLA